MMNSAPTLSTPPSSSQNRTAISRSVAFFVIYGLATLPIGIASIAVNALLLPEQIAVLHLGSTDQTVFSSLIVGGALASALANPTTGQVLDRLQRFSWCRRIALVIGLLLIVAGLLTLRSSSTFSMLLFGEILTQFGVGVLLGALSAYLPGIAPKQRATAAAISGMAPTIGGVIGQALAAHAPLDNAYLILLGVTALFIACSLLLREKQEHEAHQEELDQRTARRAWWTLASNTNFVWTWISRFLFYSIFTTLVNYSSYYVQSLHFTQVTGQPLAVGEQLFFVTLTVSLVGSSLVCGILSDRFQRRRPFTIGASLALVMILIALVFNASWTGVLPLTAAFGLASGAFVSSDIALAVAILPSVRNRARDLGWMNTCIYIPMISSPLMATVLLGSTGSFRLLFSVLAGIAAAALGMGLVKTA